MQTYSAKSLVDAEVGFALVTGLKLSVGGTCTREWSGLGGTEGRILRSSRWHRSSWLARGKDEEVAETIRQP